jgi:hypothetical protein
MDVVLFQNRNINFNNNINQIKDKNLESIPNNVNLQN